MHEATFTAFVTNNDLMQFVKELTCNENTLDLLLVNDPFAIYNVAVITPFCTGDHNAETWHAWFPLDSPDVYTASSFDYKRANYALLSSHLGNINWLQLFMSVSLDNVEGIW